MNRSFVISILLLGNVTPASAGLTVSSWDLLTLTQDRSGDIPVTNSERITLIQNPLNHLSETALAPNSASTQYSFSWSGDNGSFDIAPTQHVETLEVITQSSGFILLTPDTHLLMSVAGSLDYTSPPGDLDIIQFDFQVRDPSVPGGHIFDVELEGGSFFLEPASGTLAFEDEFVLPGGITWRIDYLVEASNLSEPSPSGPIDTNGFFHFDLAPVPETSTLSMLAIAGLLTLHRPRRRC